MYAGVKRGDKLEIGIDREGPEQVSRKLLGRLASIELLYGLSSEEMPRSKLSRVSSARAAETVSRSEHAWTGSLNTVLLLKRSLRDISKFTTGSL